MKNTPLPGIFVEYQIMDSTRIYIYITKTSPITRKFTKVSIGKFYMSVDPNLKSRGLRSINAYHFIDRLVLQKQPRNSIVVYHKEEQSSITSLNSQMRECSNLAQQLMVEIEELKRERSESKKHLDHTEKALKDALKEMQTTIKEFFTNVRQAHSDGDVNSATWEKFATAEENIMVTLKL